jgi:hypothetical protein
MSEKSNGGEDFKLSDDEVKVRTSAMQSVGKEYKMEIY